ncbi:N-acetylglucosamine kinase [Actinoplanes ianthinogenes]|uniref:N-acetylglucosamine kinase n=2 Tax=Actinoplanes ianthinogenes TaxID=122358 RepID=A0ABN6CSD9_9ACTN|nr:N-acetylglucosamine kinase [Actinoplanes ianthinogenes]GGR51705.1 N-acetylglucosamine kinase [Actinoplanes ianthinogenes]
MVIGVDAGATTTRCVVATLDGVVAGRGTAGGANGNSSGGEVRAALGVALAAALGTVDRTAVRCGVLGAAGSAGAGRERFRAAAWQAWQDAGLAGELVTVTDLEVAFAAGTARSDGVLLLAGTGALAARFTEGKVEHRCDGYGWMLGDEGSAVWIGVRALRAVLAALDGRGEATALVDDVRNHFTIKPDKTEEEAQAVVYSAFAVPPAELGRLAPLVSEAAERGDPVATRICAKAADRLLHTYDSVGPGGDVTVLAGSVLLNPGPVSRAVRAGLLTRTATPPRPALDGAGGAAALAVGRLTGTPVPPVVHARLTGSARHPTTHDPSRG